MKKLLIVSLISMFVFNSIGFALAFDEQKLLQLKPLLSERYKAEGEKLENGKIWPALGLGLLGLAVMASNATQSSVVSNENTRLNNLFMGT